jgi:5-methylcytosine-specific restriction protein A
MADRPPWVKWYKTAKWRKLRLWQLKREPLCRFCKRDGDVKEATVVDHIMAHRGDMVKFFDRGNLQSLCKHHHDSTKQRLEKSGEWGCNEQGLVPAWMD